MLNRRSDLPLNKDPATRFLPWLIAFMVYLAALAVAGVMVLDRVSSDWEAGVSHTLTVQIPPGEDEEKDQEILANALNLLNRTHGVAQARAVPLSEVLTLLEPWLGKSETIGNLPLPMLIDVELAAASAIDLPQLTRDLEKITPGVSVDDHSVWLQRLIQLVQSIQMLAASVLGLIGFATVGTLVFTTRAGLALHHPIIETLHLIGAHDSYVGRQFGHHAMVLGLKGGVIGVGFAVPTLFIIGYLAGRLESTLLPDLALGLFEWTALAILPVITALIARFTARATVQRRLKKMI